MNLCKLDELIFQPGHFLQGVAVQAALLVVERPQEGVGVAESALIGQDQVGLAFGRKTTHLTAQGGILKLGLILLSIGNSFKGVPYF